MKSDQLIDVQYQTALLESLGWDEEMLATLFDYLDTVFNNHDVVHPSIILKTVEENFNFETKKILEEIFKKVAIINNFHISGAEDEQ